eukprot:GILK01000970.1.p1 GENE.GILK01000970.1~~GILK01000970.1.p1  ORF type:complete len:449 (+),score=80.01 GILK01000970.1:46-1347(+)
MAESKKPSNGDHEEEEEEEEVVETQQMEDERVAEMVKAMTGLEIKRSAMSLEHKFWDTQPVPKLDAVIHENGPIETKTLSDVRAEPYALPANYRWCTCNVDDEAEIQEIYNLLNENYVEDDDNMFRFDYSVDFLRWALKPPGFNREFHLGVRASTNKLVGFITGVPAEIMVYGTKISQVEINFLCVHKKLRSKRLAPVLIKEITRRVNLTNVWQAVYTAGVLLPRPVASTRYFHRSLNPKKLIAVGFSRLAPRMTMNRTIRLYKLPATPQIPNIRPMTAADVPKALALLSNYLQQFSLYQVYSEEEFAHWFLPRPNVIYSYVVENPKTHEITDMCSFYNLPSTIIGNPEYNTLRAAYSYQNVATSVPLVDLMNDALIFAKNNDFDVFNGLNVMHNDTFLKELKFGIGDGNLRYYLYNWKCPEMQPQQMGLVLL